MALGSDTPRDHPSELIQVQQMLSGICADKIIKGFICGQWTYVTWPTVSTSSWGMPKMSDTGNPRLQRNARFASWETQGDWQVAHSIKAGERQNTLVLLGLRMLQMITPSALAEGSKS